MRAYERLIKYAKVYTMSETHKQGTPSTPRQFDLGHMLADEMNAMGFEGVEVDEHAYTYGFLPASKGLEDKACVAFISHMDTSPDFYGENVKPQVIENYDCSAIKLGDSGRVLSPEQFPDLLEMKGKTLICTDGSTLLGADDKAGIAEILTACEELINENIPHGRIAVCFTPDEEIGHGADLLDLEKLGADFGYTVDGGSASEFSYETFNAAAAEFEIKGFNVHPGYSKNTMINAGLVAMEINSMLPAGDVPAKTEKYEGFYHLMSASGSVEKANLSYIIRDHDKVYFEARKDCMRHIEKVINEKYGEGTAKLTITDQYSNMYEYIKDHEEILEYARNAIKNTGLKPDVRAIRGGTDGSRLSLRGLPCPNLGTGGHSAHGPYEHICTEDMDLCTDVVLSIIREIAK